VEVRDHYGLALDLRYDRDGKVCGWSTPRGKVELKHSPQGQPTGVETSWGLKLANALDPKTGVPHRTEVTEADARAVLEFQGARLTRFCDFDGGELRVAYHAKGSGRGSPREVRAPNGLLLRYEYGPGGRLAAVDCGGVYRVSYAYDSRGRLVGVTHAPVRPQ
jgi:YD repeat-containing protein